MIKIKFIITLLLFHLPLVCMDLANDKETLIHITGSDLILSDDESEQETPDYLSAMPDLVIEKICSHLDINSLLSLRTTGKTVSKKVLTSAYSLDNINEEWAQDPLPFSINKKSVDIIIAQLVEHINNNVNEIAQKWYNKSLQTKSKSTSKTLYKKLCLLNRALTYKKKINTELKQQIKAEFKEVLKLVWLHRNNVSITEHKKIIQKIAHKHGMLLNRGSQNKLKSLYHRIINNKVVMATLSITALAGILHTYFTAQSLLNSPKYLITQDDGPHWKYIHGHMAMIRPLKVQTSYTCNDSTNNAQYKSFYTSSPLFGAITMAGYVIFKFIRPIKTAIKRIVCCCKCWCNDGVCYWRCCQ